MLHESLVKKSILFKSQSDSDKTPSELVSQEVARGVVKDEESPGMLTETGENSTVESGAYIPYTTIVNLSAAEISKCQFDDADIGPILGAKLSGVKLTNQEMVPKSPACRHYWVIWDSLEVKEGILYKRFLK